MSQNKIQCKLLNIAKEFKRVCEKHNLRYYMAYGTLLGAVRHNGFIPWDDDMDFYMPREDYNKLIEIDRLDRLNNTQNGFNKNFTFKHWDNTKNYVWDIGKLEDSNTTFIDPTIASNNINYTSGVSIDIIILDGGGSKIESANKHFIKMGKCASIRYSKYWRSKIKSNNKIIKVIKAIVYQVRRYLLRFDFVMKYLKTKYIKLSKVYDFDSSKYVSSSFDVILYNSSTHEHKDFTNVSYMQFEDETFPVINNYHSYLTKIYGDYMQLPPIEDRYGHKPYYVNLELPFMQYKGSYMKNDI